MIVVERQPKLPQVIETLRRPRCFTRRLHRRNQQRRQDANDGNHDEKFDHCEAEWFASERHLNRTPH
jgi:hypothetical protein